MSAPFKETAHFVIAGQRAEVTLEGQPTALHAGALTIDLQPCPASAFRLSFTGATAGSAGQCGGSIRAAAVAVGAADVIRLCDLWAELHLNDMKVGTRAQIHALAEMPGPATYEAATAYLAECGLNPDVNTGGERYEKNGWGGMVRVGYSYGSKWLYLHPDAAKIEEARALIAKIDGERFGAQAAGIDPGEADFNNLSDVIDSRDVIARIEALAEYLADLGEGVTPANYPAAGDPTGEDRSDAVAELAVLRRLAAQAEDCSGDWKYGETLIRDSYFETYAEELADDIGAVDGEAKWPNNHIDWEAAADELRQDYTAVEFNGVTYWIR